MLHVYWLTIFVEKGIIFTTLPVGLLIQQMLLKPSFCRIKRKRRLPNNIRAVNSIIKKYAIDVILNEGGLWRSIKTVFS